MSLGGKGLSHKFVMDYIYNAGVIFKILDKTLDLTHE